MSTTASKKTGASTKNSDVVHSMSSRIQDVIDGLPKKQLSLPGVSDYVDAVLTLTKARDEICHLPKRLAACHQAYIDLTNAIKKADDGLDDYALGAGCKVRNNLMEDVVSFWWMQKGVSRVHVSSIAVSPPLYYVDTGQVHHLGR